MHGPMNLKSVTGVLEHFIFNILFIQETSPQTLLFLDSETRKTWVEFRLKILATRREE